MGGRTPETCWAVNKRQDNKLENCCIWLVIYLNYFPSSTPSSVTHCNMWHCFLYKNPDFPQNTQYIMRFEWRLGYSVMWHRADSEIPFWLFRGACCLPFMGLSIWRLLGLLGIKMRFLKISVPPFSSHSSLWLVRHNFI